MNKNLTKIFFTFCMLLSFFVMLWQKTRSLRLFFNLPECCFYPSCSDYFLEAIKKHGLLFGALLGVRRLFRCHPLCNGGIDEVPGGF